MTINEHYAEIRRLQDIQWHLSTAEYHHAANWMQKDIDYHKQEIQKLEGEQTCNQYPKLL